jgi:hypothetical protein
MYSTSHHFSTVWFLVYSHKLISFCCTIDITTTLHYQALLGAVSQRGWSSPVGKSNTIRIIVLDEKRRKGVLNMAAAVYALASIVRHPNILSILQAEGVQAITAKGFYEWWKHNGGFARKHLYNDHFL